MPYDCQLSICEELDLPKLLTLTETSKQFIPIVENILRRRFLKKSVTIVGLYPNGENISPKFYTRETVNDIRIQHFETATKLLKQFGNLIKNLRIEHYFMPTNELKLIYQLVNLHCSQTLTELYMDNDVEDVLAEFTVPFKHVQSVTLAGIFKRLNNAKLVFGKMFPQLRRLTLKTGSVLDRSWVDQTFQHLEHLHVNVWTYGEVVGCFSESVLERLFSTNPHIKSLELGNATPKVLKMLLEKLTKLEKLDLFSFAESESIVENPDFHFENLKRFTVNGIRQRPQIR